MATPVMYGVIAVILLLVLWIVMRIVRSLSGGTFVLGGRNRRARLAIMDATAVDSNRRLVLVRRDEVEHLILIGGPNDLVVEQNIRPHGSARQENIEPPVVATPRPSRPVQEPVIAQPRSPARQAASDAEVTPAPRPQPVAPVVSPAAERATPPSAPVSHAAPRREPSIEPETAAIGNTNSTASKPDDGSIEDEMARLLNDFTPEPKR